MIERKLDIPKAGKNLEEVARVLLIAIGIAAFDACDAGEDKFLHGPECDIYIFISFRVQHSL